MESVCKKDMCTACGACVDICPKGAVSIQDTMKACNALIDLQKCVHCSLCKNVCQVNHPLPKAEPLEWLQGWSMDSEIRRRASSGGFATAIMRSFVQNQGIVYSCCLKNGAFVYERADTVQGVDRFTGSKYVKSSPSGIYRQVKADLTAHRSVLFVGLPCHVAALKKFVGDGLWSSLYTIDLICHGSPSPKILELFLAQHNFSLKNQSHILFRTKGEFSQYKANYRPITDFGIYDKYSFAFLDGLMYTENCYYCQYATKQRVSDLTIGDSWGSSCNEAEQKSGISLALLNTGKGRDLIENSGLHLEAVNIANAIEHNGQLSHPSHLPLKRKDFFDLLASNHSIDHIVWKLNFPMCAKAAVKRIFVKTGLIEKGTVFSIALAKPNNHSTSQV